MDTVRILISLRYVNGFQYLLDLEHLSCLCLVLRRYGHIPSLPSRLIYAHNRLMAVPRADSVAYEQDVIIVCPARHLPRDLPLDFGSILRLEALLPS
jgi:hypothetical protein